MGIINCLIRLIRANVNQQLDRAEIPETLLDEILREEQANLVSVRDRTRDMIAQEKELEAEFAHARQLVAEWAGKAEAAVMAGRDDLAREALRRKRDSDENVGARERELQTQRQAVARHKDQIRQLEARHQTTRHRKDALVARHRRARAQEEIGKHLSPLETTAELDRIERKVRRSEANAAAAGEIAGSSTDARFRALDDPVVEADLRALKERLMAARPALDGGYAFEEADDLALLEADAGPDALKSGL